MQRYKYYIFACLAIIIVVIFVAIEMQEGSTQHELSPDKPIVLQADQATAPVEETAGQPDVTTSSVSAEPEEPVHAGDIIGGSRVSSVQVTRYPDANEIMSLYVELEGTVHVKGHYTYYSSDDEVYGDEVLISYDEDASFPGIQIRDAFQLESSERKMLLKFNRDEDKSIFGKAGTEGEAELVLDHYILQYTQSDVIDTAQVDDVVQITNEPQSVSVEPIDASQIRWIQFHEERNVTMQSAIEQYFQPDILEYEGPDAELSYSWAEEDLNGDGHAEWLVALHNGFYTGASWNSYIVVFPYVEGEMGDPLGLTSTQLNYAPEGMGGAVGVVNLTGHDWADLLVWKTRWSWDGTKYESTD